MGAVESISGRVKESGQSQGDATALMLAWLDERNAIRALVEETRERLAQDADELRVTLENELQSARFRQRSALAELELAQRSLANLTRTLDEERKQTNEARTRIRELTGDVLLLESERDRLRSDLAAVPWRVVRAWVTIRRYLPLRSLTKLLGKRG
jgi:chromosome segregation ATPase